MVDHVQASLGDSSLLLVDARAPERFAGANEPLDRTPGHIPGAVNHFYKRNLTDDGVMLPPERLRQQLAEELAHARLAIADPDHSGHADNAARPMPVIGSSQDAGRMRDATRGVSIP